MEDRSRGDERSDWERQGPQHMTTTATIWGQRHLHVKRRVDESRQEESVVVKKARIETHYAKQTEQWELQILTQLQIGWNHYLMTTMIASGYSTTTKAYNSQGAWYQTFLRAMDRIILKQGCESCGVFEIDEWLRTFGKLSRVQQTVFRQVISESFQRKEPITNEAIQVPYRLQNVPRKR